MLPSAMIWMKPKLFFSGPACFCGLLKRIKNTKMVHLVLMSDVGNPLVDVRGKPDASDTAFVGVMLFLVKGVNQLRNVSQILPSVVRSVSIDVVNLALRHSASHKQKRQSMGFVHFPNDGHYNVSVGVNASSSAASILGVPNSAPSFGCHVPFPIPKHFWGGAFVSKASSFFAILNPHVWRRVFHNYSPLLDMYKYNSSINDVNGAAA